MPLVSVIVPTFQRPDFLQAALRSVLGQTVKDFEMLVIDDGSSMDLVPLVNALDDNRIRYFRHESNRGEAAARTRGSGTRAATTWRFSTMMTSGCPKSSACSSSSSAGAPTPSGA
jgi:GT2 family glycosyltransferase